MESYLQYRRIQCAVRKQLDTKRHSDDDSVSGSMK
jgi:hypothetical protein